MCTVWPVRVNIGMARNTGVRSPPAMGTPWLQRQWLSCSLRGCCGYAMRSLWVCYGNAMVWYGNGCGYATCMLWVCHDAVMRLVDPPW